VYLKQLHSVCPGRCRVSIFKRIATASFQILVSFISSPIQRYSVYSGTNIRAANAVSRLFCLECNSNKQSLQNIAVIAENLLKSSMIPELRLLCLFFVNLFIFTELLLGLRSCKTENHFPFPCLKIGRKRMVAVTSFFDLPP
jgi:hypothetical protein